MKWANRKTDPGLAMSQWWVCITFEASRFYPEVSDAMHNQKYW